MPEPSVFVLGPISVVAADGQRVVLSGQQAEVLALLAGTHPAGVRTDVLYEALWGERAPRTAATGLRVVINRLRDRLAHVHPDPIVNEAGHYRLALVDEAIDRHHFDVLVSNGRACSEAGDHDGAIVAFERALGFWRGDPLQTTGDLWPLSGEQSRLEELRAETEERLVDSLMHAGRTDDAVTAASSMMRDFELRERRWELLVLALYRAGRQAEALRVYRRAERLLSEDYGLQPGPRLAALELRLLQQDPSLLLIQPATADSGSSPAGPGGSGTSGLAPAVLALRSLKRQASASLAPASLALASLAPASLELVKRGRRPRALGRWMARQPIMRSRAGVPASVWRICSRRCAGLRRSRRWRHRSSAETPSCSGWQHWSPNIVW